MSTVRKPVMRRNRAHMQRAQAAFAKAAAVPAKAKVRPSRVLAQAAAPLMVDSPVMQVGSLVRASDRENYGYVTHIDPRKGVSVRFTNPDSGHSKVVTFAEYELTLICTPAERGDSGASSWGQSTGEYLGEGFAVSGRTGSARPNRNTPKSW